MPVKPRIRPESLVPRIPEIWEEVKKLRTPDKEKRRKARLSALLGLAGILLAIAREVLDQDEESLPPSDPLIL